MSLAVSSGRMMTRVAAARGFRCGATSISAIWLAVAVGVAVGGGACDSEDGGPAGGHDNPSQLRDVTGVPYGWQCVAPRGACQVAPTDATPPPAACEPSATPGYAVSWGRFFDICDVCVDPVTQVWSTEAGRCRLVACSADADCPVIFTDSPISVYVCRNGICQSADTGQYPPGSLKRFEVEDLCFAVHDRAETADAASAASSSVEAALDAACTGPSPLSSCDIPTSCRVP
jgi:hypothetical protein